MLKQIGRYLSYKRHPAHRKPEAAFAILYSIHDDRTGKRLVRESAVRARGRCEAWKILKDRLQEEFGKEHPFGGIHYRKTAIKEV